MRAALLVALGGAVGSVLRYAIGGVVSRGGSAAFPWGTLVVNVLGSFAIGGLLTLTEARVSLSPELRLLLVTGVLGGFTTFSAFSWETLALARAGLGMQAAAYVAASIAVGLAAAWAGHLLARG